MIINAIKKNIETNKKLRLLEIITVVILFFVSSFSFIYAENKTILKGDEVKYIDILQMYIDSNECDDDLKACEIKYTNGNYETYVRYENDEFTTIPDAILMRHLTTSDGLDLFIDPLIPENNDVSYLYKQIKTNELMPIFNLSMATFILAISVLLVMFFSKSFTTYEKIWFVSIMLLSTVVSVLFPEESANGVNGIVIMLLYLLDSFFNILCELLISKQSRYNFIVSLAVEIIEILICIVLMYRFATMAVTLFFWIPIDIVSFINWSNHKDDEKQELTIVRKLTGYQEVLVVLAIIIWTIIVGYVVSGLDITTDFFANRTLEKTVIYLDACVSAIGIANGLFILLRLKEQWIAWYIYSILDAIINVLSGQYVLLVLKLAYLINTTYGYIKWDKYISSHENTR